MTAEGARARRRVRKQRWLTRVGGVVLRVLAGTWRVRWVNRAVWEAKRAAGEPVIFTLWHGDMLPLLWFMRNRGIAILISEHGDGEIVARAALSLGHRTVRGSSSRGGVRAILEVGRVLEAGGDVAVTPDGPRGPRHSYAAGAVIASQRTGAPIIALGVGVSRAWRLRSWDAFLIPKPFARVTIVFGTPTVAQADTVREAAEAAPRFAALLEAATADASRA